MNPILRNTLAVVAGLVVGSVVNMGVIKLGASFIEPPIGVDPSDMESIKAHIGSYGFKDFIVPLMAHAFGTMSGAYATARIAVSNKLNLAMAIGFLFLLGGVSMIILLPETPVWMKIVDVVGAYIPMAWLGAKVAEKANP